MTPLQRIEAELAAIAEYEQGPVDGKPAYLGTRWKLDWLLELAILEGRNAE